MAGRETIARLLCWTYTLRGHHKMIGEREYQLLQAHLLPEVRGYHTGSVKRLLSFPTRLHRARGCGLETFKKFCNQRFVSQITYFIFFSCTFCLVSQLESSFLSSFFLFNHMAKTTVLHQFFLYLSPIQVHQGTING